MSLKGKLVLIGLGVGVGYILGAKAGRERYDQIAKAASTVWNAPLVKDVRGAGATFVNNRLDDLGSLLKLGAANVIDRATGAKKRSSTQTARKSGGTTTRRTTSSSKSGSSSTKLGSASSKSGSKPAAKAAEEE